MEAAVCMLAVLCVLLSLLFVASERQHFLLARFLGKRDQASRERVNVPVRTKGAVRSAQAVNDVLDGIDEAHIRNAESKRHLFDDLASFSHDVRTPLAGAQGYLQLYQVSPDKDEREECVREATKRLDAMRVLVDDLYDYMLAAAPSPSESLEDVAVFDVLADCLADAYPAFVKRGWQPCIAFEDEAVRTRANTALLARIFGNLLTNCVRYGTGAPTVVQKEDALSFSNPIGDQTALSLDAGRVFDRFYRGDAARSDSGSGLGLATAKTLAESMGMKMSARVAEGRFTITLSFIIV